jgi:hypothetical protein
MVDSSRNPRITQSIDRLWYSARKIDGMWFTFYGNQNTGYEYTSFDSRFKGPEKPAATLDDAIQDALNYLDEEAEARSDDDGTLSDIETALEREVV